MPESPCWPNAPFEPSPHFCAWLDLLAARYPLWDMPPDELMRMHQLWVEKYGGANADNRRKP